MPANRAEQRHRRQASSHRAKNTKAQATNPNPNLTCGIHLWERRPRREANHQAPAKLAPGATLQQGTKHKAQAPHRFCGAGLPANRAEQRHRRQASSHRAKNTKAQATNPNPNRSCRSGAPPRCGPSSNTYAGNTPNSLPGHPVFDLETGNPLKLTLIIGHKNPAG